MTQEEKNLLLRDLCARLPYGVIVDYKENEFEIPHWKITVIYPETMDGWISYDKKIGAGSESGSRHFNIGKVKPYLRPMSSMTEEEFQRLHSICPHATFNKTNESGLIIGIYGSECGRISRIDEISKLIDWLNAHHFDYRGLIEKGLALEAPDGMYE